MTFGEYLNSQFTLAQHLEFFLRILIACVCGSLIGLERTKRFKEAGVRTHMIVCAAASLIMLVSKYGFADLNAANGAVFNGTRGADPARIAAQVVSGISFLGAGVIFKNGSTVKGLTTAAGIWATAGIGLAIGTGMYWTGLFATLVVAVLQITMHRFTVGADSYVTNRFQVTAQADSAFRDALEKKLKEWKAQTVESRLVRTDDGCIRYEMTLMMPKSISAEELLAFFREFDDIVEVSASLAG